MIRGMRRSIGSAIDNVRLGNCPGSMRFNSAQYSLHQCICFCYFMLWLSYRNSIVFFIIVEWHLRLRFDLGLSKLYIDESW